MKLAIIVPTSNRKEKLRKCLDSIFDQTFKDFSLFVVINGSTDGSKAMVEREFRQAQILNFSAMLGSAGSYKKGLEYAYKNGFDWFWLMDDDAWADEKALEYLVKESKLDNMKVFTSVGLNPDKIDELSWQTSFKKNKLVYKYYNDFGKKPLIELDVPSYVGLFFAKIVLEKVGYPDENFFTWGDDVDYCMRMGKAGFKMFYVRESLVYHPNPTKEFKLLFKTVWVITGAPWKEYYILRNHVYVWLKSGNRFKTLFWRLPKQFLLYLLIVSFFEDQKPKRIYYYTRAFIDGVRGKLGLTVLPSLNN